MTFDPPDELGQAAADVLDLAFSGEIWFWRGPAPWYFVTVPHEASVAIHAVSAVVSYGWGVIPVRVRIAGSAWETSLFPKDGRYLVPIRAAVRAAEQSRSSCPSASDAGSGSRHGRLVVCGRRFLTQNAIVDQQIARR